jgi:hypothetical protein
MKIFPLLFCLILFFAFAVSAQTNPQSNCPEIYVSGGGFVEPGEPMSYTVNVKGFDASKLSFNWSITTGEILAGQGTSTIKVLKKKDDRQNLTVTVEVKGLPESCGVVTASETEPICSCVIVPVLFDEFGKLPNSELRARFDAFFVALGKEPNAQGYIIHYGTNREIASREALFRKHISFRKYEANRITFVRGGANPTGQTGFYTRLWLVPPGADIPTP